jgi:GntR family transcriptional regulator
LARIDTNSPVPKYYQLKEIIRGRIESEELGEGQLIPSERELCESYGISRMTARQAVMELVNEGVLYREQGKGTFVAGKKVQQEAERLTSFTEDMRERGMEASSVVLEVEVEPAGPVVARFLRVEEGERIIRLKRLRNADGEPMALETSHLLYGVASGVLEVAPGSPALLIERVTFDAEGRPFEYVESTYRGDRYRITSVLHL